MIFIILLGLLVVYIWKFYANVKKYPKGPFPLPLIGNLHQYDWARSQHQISDWSKEYGNIFTLFLPRPFVCIMDYDNLKEAFVTKGDDFSGRSQAFPDTVFWYIDNGGVIFSDGESWKDHRRFAIQTLRDFGMGKNKMEEQIIKSISETLKYLKAMNVTTMDLRWPIQVFVSNVISTAIFAKWFEYADINLKVFSDAVLDYIETIKTSKLFFFCVMWPSLSNFLPFRKVALQRVLDSVKPLKRLIWSMTHEAIEQFDLSSEPECLSHAYALLRDKNPNMSMEEICSVTMDFFIAGMETSSTTLKWAFLYLAKNQDIQDKVRREIEENIGFDDLPKMSDRIKLPYCNAVLNEVQRCANIVPMNVTHRTVCETEVAGHKIPNNTLVYGMISHVLAKSERFEEPHKFKPERFLLADGCSPNKKTLEHLIPFSVGKRQCAGEALARVEMFIGFVSLLQNYKFLPEEGKEIDLVPIPGQILCPKPQSLRLVPTNANK